VQAQLQIAALQSQLEDKTAALTRAEEELSSLRAATSTSAAALHIHQLENSLKNVSQSLQALREAQEGSMGFAPAAAAGRSNASSMKEKRYEETIQDLQFQLLYGETSKDIQIAKLNETILADRYAHAHERLEVARLRAEIEGMKEKKVEAWLMAQPFMAVM